MSASEFYEKMMAPPMRRAYQLGYSIEMVSRIACDYDSAIDSGADLCAHAMLDSFYVHIRLLVEFLVRRTPTKDFGPSDFGLAWDVSDIARTEEGSRLLQFWKDASEYVVHFGKPRVPDDLSDLREFSVSGASFRSMAGDALVLIGRFISNLRSAESGSGERVVPSPAETLYEDYRHACQRLGVALYDPSK